MSTFQSASAFDDLAIFLKAVALLHRMVTNVEDIRANQGSVDQRTTGVELNIRSKMGTEREDGSEPNPPKAAKCASNENQSSSSTQPEESTSASSRWQTALIWITLGLPLFAVLLQLVWEHVGPEAGDGRLAEGPIVPLGLAWYKPHN